MRTGALACARARAQSGLLLALVGVVLAASFALIGLDALHRSAERDAVGEALHAGPARDAALSVEIATDREGDLGERVRSDAFRVVRSVRSEGVPVRHGDTALTLVARADAGLPDRSTLVDGTWPTAGQGDQIHAALQARAAKSLGIAVGDRLRVVAEGKGTPLQVLVDGTWLPKDPAAVAWFGDSTIASGTGPDGSGPLVVSDADLARLPASATTSYVLTPRSSGDLPGLRHDLAKLTVSLEATEASETVTGGLPQRVADLETTLAAGNGLLAVAYALVALVALVACRQVVALLTEARRTETALLRSRGATTFALTASAMVEAVVVAVAGAAAGLGAATAVFTIAGLAPDALLAFLVAAACALVTVTLAGLATWSPARRAGLRRDEPRDPRGARTTVLVLVLAAAGLSVSQFIAYDGPLSGTAAGGTRVDPVTSLAPAAALAALALLGAACAAPFLRVLERRAVRRNGLAPALAVRQLTRRLSTFSAAIVLVSLAVGFAILTATVNGTQASLDEAAARVRNGADLRLDLDAEPSAAVGVESTTAPLIDLGNTSAAVILAPGRVDQEKLSFLASTADLPKVAAASREDSDSAQITSALAAKQVGVPIEPGSVDVHIDSRGATFTGYLESTLWLVDGRGQVAVRPLGAVAPAELDDGTVTRTTVVPPSPTGWRLLAVDAKATGISGDVSISFRGLPGADRYDADLTNGRNSARAMAGRVPARLPVVITPAVAALIDVREGDTFDLLLPDSGFKQTVTVAGTAPTIPGIVTSRGIAADLPTLVSYALSKGDDVPSPRSVWIATDQPRDVARDATSASIVPTTTTTAAPALDSRVVASAVRVWLWAAGAVIVFAALAIAAMNANLGRARRGELQVLRALGLAWRQQSRLRSAELCGAIGVGAALGVLAGLVTVLLTTSGLSRSATPGRPASVEPQLSLAVPGLLALMAFLALSLVIVGIVHARRIRRQARRLGWRGDAV